MKNEAIGLDRYIKAGNAQGVKTTFDIWLEQHEEWLVSKVGRQECGEVVVQLFERLLHQVGRQEQKPNLPAFDITLHETI